MLLFGGERKIGGAGKRLGCGDATFTLFGRHFYADRNEVYLAMDIILLRINVI
jgi:hypothetical protein